MTLTHKIYEELFSASEYEKQQISKRYDVEKQYLIFAAERTNGIRHLYFGVNQDKLDSIPKCNGIEIGVVQLPEYEVGTYFCDLAQSHGSEAYIFETIVEDIRLKIVEKPHVDAIAVVSNTLYKWKEFFAKNREILMSPERQQGLYGELRFLEELIMLRGTKAVLCWTGCNYETHDFYVEKDAFEVKTTVSKAPYKMHISSEYQLDTNEVEGSLYVRFYAFRKSEASGEQLAEIVQRIRATLADNPHALSKLNEGLEEYGYFDAVSDRYITGYSDRVEETFLVKEGFPRITPQKIGAGVANCVYDVLVESCRTFRIGEEEIKEIVTGENANG